MIRIGMGYDVHRLGPDRALVLGGVEIPFEYGLLGHSDADVLTHAVCDAILGAAALGDIGQHFPDTDPAYSGVSSLVLLRSTLDMAAREGLEPLTRQPLAGTVPQADRDLRAAEVDRDDATGHVGLALLRSGGDRLVGLA